MSKIRTYMVSLLWMLWRSTSVYCALENESLKPSMLKQHLETSHPAYALDDRVPF